MPYYRLFYHLVWGTKYRQPALTPVVEPIIHSLLRGKAIGLEGTVFAINGIEDHVHMVVSIPPKISVAKFIGQVKAAASAIYNDQYSPETPFYWQSEYGAFTFDGKRLPHIIRYVEQQKIHHAAADLIPVLECDSDNRKYYSRPRTLREPSTIYGDYALWWQEMLALDDETPPGDHRDKKEHPVNRVIAKSHLWGASL